MSISELLNSSSDSYILHDEENPSYYGRSRCLFPPGTKIQDCVGILKMKLKKATRRANINYTQLKCSMQRNMELTREMEIALKLKDEQMDKLLQKTNQTVNNMDEEFERLQAERDEIDKRLKAKKAQLKEANQRNEQLKERVQELESKVESLNAERDELSQFNKNLIQSNQELIRSNQELNQQIRGLSADVSTMTSKFVESRAYIKENELALEMLNKLRDAISSETDDFERFKIRVLPPSDEISPEQSIDWVLKATHCFNKERMFKFEATKRKVDELESKLNERDGKVSSLSKQCHQYKSELTELQETLKKERVYIKSLHEIIDARENSLRLYKFAESEQYARLCQEFDLELTECLETMVQLVSKVKDIYHNNNDSQDSDDNFSRLRFTLSSQPRCVLEEAYLNQRISEINYFKQKSNLLKSVLSLYA